MAEESAGARAIQHDGWGELVLDRPARRNAITGPMVASLRAGLASLTEAGARVILLRGEGGAFCSGLDLDAFGADPAPAWRASFQETWSGWHRDLYLSRAVIVGALERFAINGGASMAIACDLLVAGEGATILVGEAAQGMYAPMNTAWLRLKTTEAIAAQLTLAARRVPAADLLRLGLVYEVVADDKVLERAREVAAMLAGYPGQGLAAIKEAMRRPLHGPADGAFEQLRAPAVATSAAPRRVEKA